MHGGPAAADQTRAMAAFPAQAPVADSVALEWAVLNHRWMNASRNVALPSMPALGLDCRVLYPAIDPHQAC